MWIEIQDYSKQITILEVHPHLGVWIEIQIISSAKDKDGVHPHLGVWIEIRYASIVGAAICCSPPLGGVDWNGFGYALNSGYLVHPHLGVWIEINYHKTYKNPL